MGRAEIKKKKAEDAQSGRPKAIADAILTLDDGETLETVNPRGRWGILAMYGCRDVLWFEPAGEAYQVARNLPEMYSLRLVSGVVSEILGDLGPSGEES
jgi:hypothetical protein